MLAFQPNIQRMPKRQFGREMSSRPKTIKAMAKRFMAFRAAQREAFEPVDSFCQRGETIARFAYFD